jgi:D-alanine-D-alanine ligase
MSNNNITVALLVGGTSPEREVSKSSGKSILNALHELGYIVKVADPAYGMNQPKDEEKFFSTENYSGISNRNYIELVYSAFFNDVDVAFLALHGKWGEDGTIQSLLELRGIKYTGSKILASALAMDKAATKDMFLQHGVPTPKWLIVGNNENDFDLIKTKIQNEFGYPCVVKPNDQGSTVGLTICKDDASVEEAVKKALEFSSKALIEEYIPGRELTIAIIDQNPLQVLEIKPKSGLYDYESKYTHGKTEYIVPADIPQDLSDSLRKSALTAFNSAGCESYGRIDFRLTDDNKFYCLEINTLPGMTSTSLVPKMAKAAGLSFEDLIDKIVKNSLQ